ncbi:hypothetical protein HMPREF1981_00939 [Bacteroides pyogenes F0041]|uniref:Uncharacterized protein n=1 Tax=Bacteroides pyogenes F0041 TaxID=1321819 RepID=U2CQT2_9BACE|nr:hypothetical protein HMPREF1981_00939 [Bacteroides pyogenes F0041]
MAREQNCDVQPHAFLRGITKPVADKETARQNKKNADSRGIRDHDQRNKRKNKGKTKGKAKRKQKENKKKRQKRSGEKEKS